MTQPSDSAFQTGVAAKPPRGCPHGSVGLPGRLRGALAEAAPDVLATMIVRAREGDLATAQFLISRILPSARSAPIANVVELPPSHVAAADAVLQSLANGDLSLDEAKALLDAIQSVQHIKEGSDLVTRLQAIEERLEVLGEPDV